MKKGNLYNCSMAVLYVVCRFGWSLYLRYWEALAELSGEYTEAFGQAALEAVNAAQAMPDASQRRGTVTLAGVELDGSSEGGLQMWRSLRRYIIKAIPDAGQAAAILQAGGAHFEKARKGNRAEITQLLLAGQTYLTANEDLLSTKGNMPKDFTDKYKAAKDLYDGEHIDFGSAKGTATDGTVTKREANNALYTALQSMFGDAQVVFYNNKAVAKQFSFAAVKRLVTKNMAGIHFTILMADGKPLTTATLMTGDSGEILDVNARGVCEVIMASGTHPVLVEAPGFVPYNGVVKVDAGVKHRVRIELVKEVAAAAAEEVVFTKETVLEQ